MPTKYTTSQLKKIAGWPRPPISDGTRYRMWRHARKLLGLVTAIPRPKQFDKTAYMKLYMRTYRAARRKAKV